jgi:hypothetical protein
MERTLTREQFLQAGIALLGVAVGCGDDTSSGTTGGGGGAGGGTSGTGGATTSTTGSSAGGSSVGGSGTGGAAGTGGSAAGECTAALVALISGNHGHSLTVPLVDLDSAIDVTYDTTGTAMHCHQVTLTVADFATLKSGGAVTVKSCNGGDHAYSLSCGTPPTPAAPDCSATPNLGTCG